MPAPFPIVGRDGRSLTDAWRDGPYAQLGTPVSGFPNLFIMVGPNTGLGHNSMVLMIESQIAYILDAIETIRGRGLKSLEVRPEAMAEFNEQIHARLDRAVWADGCRPWYLTRSGKNTTLWPGFTFEYRYRTRRVNLEDFDAEPE
jgi:hypothetical protein